MSEATSTPEAPARRTRIFLFTALGLVVAAGGVGAAAVASGWSPFSKPVDSAFTEIPVRRSALQARVRARGELEAVKAYPVAVPPVPTGALKVATLVAEGSVVHTGDTLITFDASQLEIELDNNLATLRGMERRIDRNRLQSSIEAGSIEAMKSVAELELETAEAVKIEDEEVFSRREILDSTLARSTAGERIVFADLSLELRGRYYDVDKGILDVSRRQASDRIQRVKTSLATLILKSPGNGMVVYRKNWRGGTVAVGNSVWPGNVLMQLVDPSETALKVYVPEKYATGLEPGQKATVRVDAFAERTYPGKVASVSKLSRPISDRSPVKYFEASVTLETPDPERLRPGMEGEAEILIGEPLADALIVPRAAIRGEGKDAYVLVAADGTPEQRPVVLGPGDLVRVAVTSGIADGESVLIGEEGDGTESADEAKHGGGTGPDRPARPPRSGGGGGPPRRPPR